MGKKNSQNVSLGNLKGRDRTEDVGVDGRITLEWILGEQSGKVWTGYIWFRVEISDAR
jgi:hypothetical protein